MTTDITSIAVPNNLREVLAEVQSLRNETQITGGNALLQVLRRHHFWPALQVKKFYHEPDLVLLHNTYKRVDVGHFQELYDECRSVVLDMSAPEGQNIIVTYAHSIPYRMSDRAFEKIMQHDDNAPVTMEMSYEGTVVTVYHYKEKWHFGTSSCPNINFSRYFHPTLSHGDMLDEALIELFPEATKETVRDAFTSRLDKDIAYAFLLVHHGNRHVMDYTCEFGENYKKLVHITSRNRANLNEDNIDDKPFHGIGILYPVKFETVQDALDHMRSDSNMYAVIATLFNGKRMKVSTERILHQEECDLGHPNKWHNMLSVYMQNRSDYHISDYEAEFAMGIEYPKDRNGRDLAPTYLIHTVICTIRDVIYQMYCQTTTYYPAFKRFRMNKQVDETYAPILRFHLAQLRYLQVHEHAESYLTPKAIYHYLCFHQTLKNVRLLIKHFAQNPANFKPRTTECFQVLSRMLHQKLMHEDVNVDVEEDVAKDENVDENANDTDVTQE